MTISIAISGALGRMGQMIYKLASKDKTIKVDLLVDQKESLIDSYKVLTSLKKKVDCLIDFSSPEGTLKRIEECSKLKVSMVIGTTGFTLEQEKKIAEASNKIAILKESNMSIGVNIVFSMLEYIKPLIVNFDIGIYEIHHKTKKDKPSGTALTMANKLGVKTTDINSFRMADVVGEHTILMSKLGEVIEISHRAYTREIFAEGAITAAKFLYNKPAGMYKMKDILLKK
ncbi:MAG: 4-hydroxy-tetrahydrodipicolinate reductase [Planctomycetes bacterium]|nr:4-hydroxy-tetrahydrodipicolinate reductase [Planctomycetota bacterium]